MKSYIELYKFIDNEVNDVSHLYGAAILGSVLLKIVELHKSVEDYETKLLYCTFCEVFYPCLTLRVIMVEMKDAGLEI